MSGHEARINDALKQLGEEFRLGMVAAEEYRARRRMLLESWGERDATTSPGNRRVPSAVATQPPAAAPRPAPAPAPAPKRAGKGWLLAAVGLIALVAVLYMVLAPRPRPSAPAPAAAASSPQVEAVRKAADDFLARNSWEADAINAFLEQWRALPAQDRALARDEPSLRTLRYKLGENIKAESQLVGADAPPAQRQRLDLLTQFARELEG